MRMWAVGCMNLMVLAGPAWAKDIALPKTNPAVTLTIPDAWDTNVRGTDIASTSPDGSVTFNVAFDVRSGLDALVRDSKDYLRENKVKLSVKPTEQTMDFAGTPGRVQRYQTSDKSGKTVIDLVTLDANRNRTVLITIWASEAERQANDADLSAIMKSIKVPADAGGGSFWSGAPPQPAKPETAKNESARGMAGALAAAGETKANDKASQPYGVRRVLFVTRKAESFGDADARSSSAFIPGEKLISYIEPIGEATQSGDGGKIRFGLVLDYEISSKDGEILAGQKGLLNEDFTSADDSDPKFYITSTLNLTGAKPGTYVLTYTLHDKLSDRTTHADQPFSIVPASAPAVAQTDGFCARSPLRDTLVQNVNAGDDFKDGKRQLKALVDPETILDDQKAKKFTCRYTAVWAEAKDGGALERRIKMTYKLAADSAGDFDIDYTFDK